MHAIQVQDPDHDVCTYDRCQNDLHGTKLDYRGLSSCAGARSASGKPCNKDTVQHESEEIEQDNIHDHSEVLQSLNLV